MPEFMSNHDPDGDRYIAPGTRVCIDWVGEDGKPRPEYGIMVHCWLDPVMGLYDCLFASFGDALPDGCPEDRPGIFQYTAASFRVIGGP